jgi:uncharacterized membrane protein
VGAVKFLFFIKRCWLASSIEAKLILGILISAYLSIVITEFAWLVVLLFLILVIKNVVDAVRDTWQDYKFLQNRLVKKIRSLDKE